MKLSEFYKKQEATFSFEFFPPKNAASESRLFETVRELKTLKPSFVSVTYGAMGTTRERTFLLVTKIREELGIETAAHLTCVGHSRAEIEEILGALNRRGIENLVALRGDPPKGEEVFRQPPGGFQYAAEMVRYIRRHPVFSSAFSVAVAGYPEGHIECRDKARDLDHLKMKVDAGADLVITQLFFDFRDYFDFVKRAQEAGIRVPIVPGIMPVTHGQQIRKFAGMCGARIPEEMQKNILRFGEDHASVEAYGIEYATRQCEDLLRGGAPGLHFYTLNKSQATRQIYLNLGLSAAGGS